MTAVVPLIQNARVVLLRTHIAANLGATARVMRNMGLTDLVLVNPVADRDDRNARQVSTHGESILDQCRIVDDLATAVDDCVLVVGTSARLGGLFRHQSCGSPEEIMPHVVQRLATGRIALVFGPEPSGMENAEISRCHFLIHIPTDETYPALNLAQAVAITLYELRSHLMHWNHAPQLPAVASFAEQERMFTALRDGLERIHFLFGDRADALMHAVRHLLGRAGLSVMEVKMLHGLARQLRWIADQAKGQGSNLQKPTDC